MEKHVSLLNEAHAAGYMSETGRVSTRGVLQQAGGRAARKERIRAASEGMPYVGHAGHVPDATWSGRADPLFWQDLTGRVNTSLGRQTLNYPIGFKPTGFVLDY